MYDLDLLLEHADSEAVAEAIGLRTERKGKNIYCACPSHKKVLGREDTNISNCVLTPHGYCCFACGAKGTVFQMVMDYCNVSFSQAVSVVAKVTGGDFKVRGGQVVKKQPLSPEDLALIGITTTANPEGDAGREIIGVSQYRPQNEVFFRRGDEYVLYSSVKRITLNQLFEEDEEMYYELMKRNAEIALNKYRELYDAFNNRGSETFKNIFEIISENGKLDGQLISEIRNSLLLNAKRIEKILEKLEDRRK